MLSQSYQYDKFIALCKRKKYFALTVHEHPDGDSLGSMFALGSALKKNGKEVRYCCNEDYPPSYDFLPEAHCIQKSLPSGWPLEVLIALDCGDLSRLAIERTNWDINSCILVNIDHHQTNTLYGHLNIVEGKASATGEIIYQLLKKIAKVDLPIAICLMVAIVTDTGFFRFANTTPLSLNIAAELVKLGIEPSRLAEQVQERKKYSTLRLLGHLLLEMRVDLTHRIAWITVTKNLFEKYETEANQIEGFVNYAKQVEGVLIGVLFKEAEDNMIRISLRSGSEIDVSKIAQAFGGGGHTRAAGCAMEGRLEQVQDSFLQYLVKYLEQV